MPRKRFSNAPDHPGSLPLQLKFETIHCCSKLRESVQLVSEEIGYSRFSIYTWRKKHILKGASTLMNYDDDSRGEPPGGR